MDAIIVGGGPAGITAAYVMAKAGLEVMVVERGEFAGSKNVGGLLYGTVLETIIPGFHATAPIERPVSRREIVYLGADKHAGIQFGSREWTDAPFNHTFVVFRSQFDRWFAAQAEEAGANLLEGMVVDELLYEGSGAERRAVGVKIRGDESFYADAVILADGANGLVSETARRELQMRPGRIPQDYDLGVKEIIGLPRATLQDRFHLDDHEGAALDFFGEPFKGLTGGAFLYTAREALHLGVAAKVDTISRSGSSPNEILERFKQHPFIHKYIRGGEVLEYSAHLIPEGGCDAITELAGNGVLITGDAAGFVNMSLYKEGTNHAMESGKLAAETVIAAKKAGDFSKASLAAYETRLREAVVMKDMKKFGKVPHIMDTSPNLFSLYPDKAVQLMVDFFTVHPEPKAVSQKRAIRRFLKGLPKWRFLRDVIRARKLM